MPLLRPMRDKGAVTMSLCRFLVFLRPVGRRRGRDISLSDIGSETEWWQKVGTPSIFYGVLEVIPGVRLYNVS